MSVNGSSMVLSFKGIECPLKKYIKVNAKSKAKESVRVI